MVRFLFVLACSALVAACSQTLRVEEKSAAAEHEAAYLTRDVRDDIFYFVMPDRFNNANPDNDQGAKQGISRGGLDVTSKWAFHGGDIQGLEEKLDYLQNLGITAIWMTPILRNKAVQNDGFAHHGYWIVDFTQIDPHFGSNDDLKSLIQAAHKRGMKIFFDIITNHTADVIKYRECHNDEGNPMGDGRCPYKSLAQIERGDVYTPFVPVKEQNTKFPQWLNDPKYYHNQGDTTFEGENSLFGDFNGLDDINTEHPDVVAGMIEIYKNIITEFRPDGFRVDTVRHVQLPFWQQFGPAIMAHAKQVGIPNFHIFGEVYDSSPARLSQFTTEGKLPAVLDFGFQKAAADVFYRGENPSVLESLYVDDDYYNDADSQADLLLTFLGNHDMGRPGYFIAQGMENASEQEKVQRSILSHAFMYMSRGIPVVYYGDEQGFTGDGNDVDAREDMFPSQVASYNDNLLLGTGKTTAENNFDVHHPIYQAVSELARLRKAHRALRRGIHINRYFDENASTFAFSRMDLEEKVEYLVLFNTGTEPSQVNLPASAKDYQQLSGNTTLKVEDGHLSVAMEPLSFALLKAREKVATQHWPHIALESAETAKDATRLLHLRYRLKPKTQQAVPLVEVTTEYQNGVGEYELVARDYTAPYSAYLPKELLSSSGEANIRVTVNNFAGSKEVKHFTIAP